MTGTLGNSGQVTLLLDTPDTGALLVLFPGLVGFLVAENYRIKHILVHGSTLCVHRHSEHVPVFGMVIGKTNS